MRRGDLKILIADEILALAGAGGMRGNPGEVKILIADENPATLEYFSHLLEDRGFTTLTAGSGEAAWELLEQELLKPYYSFTAILPSLSINQARSIKLLKQHHSLSAIIIGDLMKPPIDGLDLIRRLRSSLVPVVVATSYGADYMLLARLAGAQIIVHKFSDPAYLITTIEEALRRAPNLMPELP